MKKKYGSPILDSSFRIITPFTLIYGVYVFLNGEISPGGGFQAGALLAVGVVLSRLIIGADNTTYNVTGRRAVILAGVGTFIYALTGWVTMLRGGKFLDYGYLPFALGSHGGEILPALHATGITFIEIGVTICVMMTIIDMLDVVVERTDTHD